MQESTHIAYPYILNNCGWKITEPISLASKFHFLQHLIYNEVTQREANLRSFFLGLNGLGVGELVKTFPSLTTSLFVAGNQPPLTADVFTSLILGKRPENQPFAET